MDNNLHRELINLYLVKHRVYLKTSSEFRTLLIFYVLFLLSTSAYIGIVFYLDKPYPGWMLTIYSFLAVFSLILGSGWVLVMKKQRVLQQLKAQIDKAGLVICKNDDSNKVEILDSDRVPSNYLAIPQYSKINFSQYKKYFR